MVESGIILLKYWLEVSPEEQTRRLEARIDDGRKIWKLSPMDLKSYSRWYDYSRARDEMFAATDTGFGAVVRGALRRQEARAAQHHHAPAEQIPYKSAPREKVEAAEAAEARRLPGAGLPVQVRRRAALAAGAPLARASVSEGRSVLAREATELRRSGASSLARIGAGK